MKKKIISGLFFVFFLFFLFEFPVLAAEKIKSFDMEAVVNLDGTVDLKETILYDFGSESKHGIYRKIPLSKETNDGKAFLLFGSYRGDNFMIAKEGGDGKTFLIDLSLNSIRDQNGSFWNFYDESTKKEASFKVGDPDIYINGVKTYVIDYKVSGALTYFEDHDEFYWNVNGTDWTVGADKVSAQIVLPEELQSGEIYWKCYTGKSGSKETDCSSQRTGNSIYFESDESFLAGDNLTVVVGFPTGVVQKLEPVEDKMSLWQWLSVILIGLLLLFLYIILPIILVIIYFKKGRDPKVQKGPTAWFDVPKHDDRSEMMPAEVGVIIDEKIDPRDVSATILHLAISGFLVIEKTGKGQKDYKFVKSEKEISGLNNFEKTIYEGIFEAGVKEKDLKTLEKTFYKAVEKGKKNLYEEITQKGYFEKNPEKVRNNYIALAIVASFIANIFLAIILFIMAKAMPKKTVKGAEKKEESLALKRFLESQDKQLEFQEKNWYFFEKLLPYAIAFGVAKVWAKKFEDLQVPQEISWYRSNDLSGLATIAFVNNLTRFSTMTETMSGVPYSSSRSSSGFSSGFSSGGFSGGGGGGGGGGSW